MRRLLWMCRIACCLAGAAGLIPGQAPAPQRTEASAHHRQGLELFRTGDAAGAVRELERSVAIDPAYAEAWNDLGVIRRRQGDLAGALRCFEKSVAAKPDYVAALLISALPKRSGDRPPRAEAPAAGRRPAAPFGAGACGAWPHPGYSRPSRRG